MGGARTGRRPDNVGMRSFLRKPLGVFAVTLALGSVLLAVGMTAFGGTSGGSSSGSSYHSRPPLTAPQFRRAGERIGLSICLKLAPIVNRKPRTLRAFTKGMRRITSLVDRMTAQLNGLVPPPSAARPFERFLRKINAADHAIDHADHFAETHQWRRFVLLVRSRGWKNVFRKFGPITKGKLRCGQSNLAIV